MILIKKLMKRKEFTELFRFIIIGSISVFIDFVVYKVTSLFLPIIFSKNLLFLKEIIQMERLSLLLAALVKRQ